MIRERFARWPLALERLHSRRLGRCPLRRQFFFRSSRLQLFKLKLHLLQQSILALRARAVQLSPQLLDLELEVIDQRGFGLRFQPRGALGKDHRMRRGKISGKRFGVSHVEDGITSIAIRNQKLQPTDVGRHVCCGCRQSMPDNR